MRLCGPHFGLLRSALSRTRAYPWASKSHDELRGRWARDERDVRPASLDRFDPTITAYAWMIQFAGQTDEHVRGGVMDSVLMNAACPMCLYGAVPGTSEWPREAAAIAAEVYDGLIAGHA